MSAQESAAVLVRQVRCGLDEILHAGAISVHSIERECYALGNTASPVPLRSTAKVFFVAALRETYLASEKFSAAELALMSSSHNGEPEHRRVVSELLSRYGLSNDDLKCGCHYKFHTTSEETPVANQCSGKHAMFLIANVVAGYPKSEYLDPAGQVHETIRQHMISRLFQSGMVLGIDGCALPTYAVPLRDLARAYARFAADGLGGSYSEVRRAQLAAPYFVGGTDRLDSHLIGRWSLAAKAGSAGLWAIGSPSLRLGFAGKILDGDEPAVQCALLECLDRLGALRLADDPYLHSYHRRALRTWSGLPAGLIEPCFPPFQTN